MLLTDLELLVCPSCQSPLHVARVDQSDDAKYLLAGQLACARCSRRFEVRGGVVRMIEAIKEDNPAWNYKWTKIDRGRGLNHAILDPGNPAYALHDLYDRNGYGGEAFERMRGGAAIEIGCGVGQYVIKSLLQYGPEKIVAVDLTEGVDTLRKIVVERYRALLPRILFVQASVFALPFRPASFDYVYSLGVLHHTGDTERAVRAAAALVKEGGELNIWVYAAAQYHVDTREPGREHLSAWRPLLRLVYTRLQARLWYSLFARLSAEQADHLLRPFSSERWYIWSQRPWLGLIVRAIMSPPRHPDRDYRHINLFDGFVSSWAENWSEAELFEVLRDSGIVVKGISRWRVGLWGVKAPAFYQRRSADSMVSDSVSA